METKVCKKCGRELPTTEFYSSHKSKDGLQNYCKECQKNQSATRYNAKRKKTKYGLLAYTPRELMEELKRRGYTGKLEYTETRIIDFEKL